MKLLANNITANLANYFLWILKGVNLLETSFLTKMDQNVLKVFLLLMHLYKLFIDLIIYLLFIYKAWYIVGLMFIKNHSEKCKKTLD